MKMSMNWLRSLYPDCGDDVAALSERLSEAGLEVESVDPAAVLATGVVVAEILSAEQHPDADRLKVCQVSTGSGEPLTIVCGAANARAGIKVALIQLGGVLPSGDDIKPCKLRGIASSGMLCAAEELGLQDTKKGIMELPLDAPVGQDLMEYLGLRDDVLDIAITPNRGDCLGMHGLVREMRALNGDAYQAWGPEAVSAVCDDRFAVSLEDAACPRYVGRVIRGISMDVDLPWWMKERLRRAGTHMTGNPVVDIVNYVMLETGQPMHAFDLNVLRGSLVVRSSQEGESLLFLGADQEEELKPGSLIIADKEGPVALAGVMGGQHSAVSEKTVDLFLEAAYFQPDAVSASARAHRVSSDSSYRFERGVDWQLPIKAIERLTSLLLDIVGGQPGPVEKTESAKHLPEAVTVKFPKTTIERYLGLTLDAASVVSHLERLGLSLLAENDDAWEFSIPSFRSDITGPEDLVEEVARLHGYDQIPSQPLRGELMMPEDAAGPRHRSVTAIKHHMVSQGFQEVVTYSFVPEGLDAALVADNSLSAIRVSNPISEDMAVMRRSLLPGLLGVWASNSKRQISRLQVFEYGQCFLPREGGVSAYVQEDRVAGLMVGPRHSDDWRVSSDPFDFFDAKEAVMQLLAVSHRELICSPGNHPALHPHQQLVLQNAAGDTIGYIGQCHPRLSEEYSWRGKPMVFEVRADYLLEEFLPEIKSVSKFPFVRRDLSFVMPDTLCADDVAKEIQKISGYLLIKLNVFDIFHSDTLGEGKKSVSYGLFFQDVSRTLVDQEIDDIIQRVVAELSGQFGVQLRE